MFTPSTPGEWEHLIIDLWAHVTPIILVMAALILGSRLVFQGKWKSRMARASFLLIASYGVLMVRVLMGIYNPNDGDGLRIPIPIFALFYLFAALYFGYAMFMEWGVPFFIWAYRRMRYKDFNEPLPEELTGVDHSA